MIRGTAIACMLATACGAPPARAPAPPAPPPEARIEVATGACPPAGDARTRIERVLDAHGARRGALVVRVTSAASGEGLGDGYDVQLGIVRPNGDVGLERTYTLGAIDCASAGELVALGVERFLSAFPEWADPPRPPPPPPRPPTRWIELSVLAAASSMWRPLGVDGAAGAVGDLGNARDRIGVSLIVRASVPQAAGGGRFQQTAILGGAVYRRRTGPWQLRAEARAGALAVSGLGYTENHTDVLPWWEGVVYGGRALGWGSLGIEVAASGLRHKAVTSDGLVSEDIPLLRLGFAGEFGVASRKP